MNKFFSGNAIPLQNLLTKYLFITRRKQKINEGVLAITSIFRCYKRLDRKIVLKYLNENKV